MGEDAAGKLRGRQLSTVGDVVPRAGGGIGETAVEGVDRQGTCNGV